MTAPLLKFTLMNILLQPRSLPCFGSRSNQEKFVVRTMVSGCCRPHGENRYRWHKGGAGILFRVIGIVYTRLDLVAYFLRLPKNVAIFLRVMPASGSTGSPDAGELFVIKFKGTRFVIPRPGGTRLYRRRISTSPAWDSSPNDRFGMTA